MRILQLLGWGLMLVTIAACSSNATPVQSNTTNEQANIQNDVVVNDGDIQSQTDNTVAVASPVPQITLDPANAGLVARVNSTEITVEDFRAEVIRSPLASVAANQAALEQDVLRSLIEQTLLEQNATALGVTVTEADIDAEVAMLRSIAVSDAQWEQFLQQNQFETEADLREAQSEVLLTRKVQDALIAQYLGNVEQVNARHIVVTTLDEATTVLNRLQAGEGFAELAAEFSIDSTTRETGGNLGWFARNELFYSNLEEVAFILNIGDIGGPIETPIGYHIIQTLEKAQRPVEAERLPMLAENVFSTWLAEQYQSAQIDVYIEW